MLGTSTRVINAPLPTPYGAISHANICRPFPSPFEQSTLIPQSASFQGLSILSTLLTPKSLDLSHSFFNMKFLSTILSLAVATGALAVPTERGMRRSPTETHDLAPRASSTASEFTATPIFGCLFPWQANNIVNAFNYLLANPAAPNFNATANALLANDYTDTSDSIDQLAGLPVRRTPSLPPLSLLRCVIASRPSSSLSPHFIELSR